MKLDLKKLNSQSEFSISPLDMQQEGYNDGGMLQKRRINFLNFDNSGDITGNPGLRELMDRSQHV